MRVFRFKLNSVKDTAFTDDNGWKYKLKLLSKVGYATLTSPITKEVTHSKGTTVRYVKHNVICVGYVKDGTDFQGLAVFEFPIRFLIALVISVGVGYAAQSMVAGCFWSFLFYMLILFLSIEDDDRIFCKIKNISENVQ